MVPCIALWKLALLALFGSLLDLNGVDAMQRQAGRATWRPAASLLHGAAVTHREAADVCDVVYVNLNESIDRRLGIEANMQQLGITARRFPAVQLDVVELPNGQRNYTAESTALLLDIFSEWGCGNWTQAQCHLGDQVCCKGLSSGTLYSWHYTAGQYWDFDKVPVSSFVGNLASHIVILQQMRGISPTDPCIGTVIMEDDMRLLPQWSATAREAVSMVPDFDIIKLYHNYNYKGVDRSYLPPLIMAALLGCQVGCSGTGTDRLCLYDLAHSVSCWRYSNGVLLVNPKSADKVLKVLELVSQQYTSQYYARQPPLGAPASYVTPAGYIYSLDLVLAGAAQQNLLKMYAVQPPVAYTADIGWNSTY